MQAVPISIGNDSGGPYAEVGLYDLPDGTNPLAKDEHNNPLYQPVRQWVMRPQAENYPADTSGMTADQIAAHVVQAMLARGTAMAVQVKADLEHQAALATAAQAVVGQVVTV